MSVSLPASLKPYLQHVIYLEPRNSGKKKKKEMERGRQEERRKKTAVIIRHHSTSNISPAEKRKGKRGDSCSFLLAPLYILTVGVYVVWY